MKIIRKNILILIAALTGLLKIAFYMYVLGEKYNMNTLFKSQKETVPFIILFLYWIAKEVFVAWIAQRGNASIKRVFGIIVIMSFCLVIFQLFWAVLLKNGFFDSSTNVTLSPYALRLEYIKVPVFFTCIFIKKKNIVAYISATIAAFLFSTPRLLDHFENLAFSKALKCLDHISFPKVQRMSFFFILSLILIMTSLYMRDFILSAFSSTTSKRKKKR